MDSTAAIGKIFNSAIAFNYQLSISITIGAHKSSLVAGGFQPAWFRRGENRFSFLAWVQNNPWDQSVQADFKKSIESNWSYPWHWNFSMGLLDIAIKVPDLADQSSSILWVYSPL